MTPLLDPRNHPCWDLPPPGGPPQSYVVASTPRTGSTWLCRLLGQTGQLGLPMEYLNPMQRRDWSVRRGQRRFALLSGRSLGLLRLCPWPDAEIRAHLQEIRACRSSPEGWFGLKIHHHHFAAWLEGRPLAPLLGAPPRWIRIYREDRVAQAVSWARALQTNQWIAAARAPRGPRPRYCRALIARCLARIVAGEAGWAAWLARQGEDALALSYESIVADPVAAVQRVLSWLDVPGAAAGMVQPQATELGRQADEESHDWAMRFRREGEGKALSERCTRRKAQNG